MTEKGLESNPNKLILWFASDGQKYRFVALDRAAAQTFADVANRHVTDRSQRMVQVRRCAATIESN